jgi:hypothetical protein
MKIELSIQHQDGSIEQATWDKISIKHFRNTEKLNYVEKLSGFKFSEILPTHNGGFTVIALNRKGYNDMAWSRCHPVDRFCKRIGIWTAVFEYVNRHYAKPEEKLYLKVGIGPNDVHKNTYQFSFSTEPSLNPYWFQRTGMGKEPLPIDKEKLKAEAMTKQLPSPT